MGCMGQEYASQRWGLLGRLATDGVRRVTEPPGRGHPGAKYSSDHQSGQLQHSTWTPPARLSLGSAANGCAPVFPKESISPVGTISPGNVGPTVHSGQGVTPARLNALFPPVVCHVKSFVQAHSDNLGVNYEAADRSLWQTLPPTLL